MPSWGHMTCLPHKRRKCFRSCVGIKGIYELLPTQGKENKLKKILNKEGQKTKVNTTTFLECHDSGLLFWIYNQAPLLVTRGVSTVFFQIVQAWKSGLPFLRCELPRRWVGR